ncbi:MAG: glycine--tRNA ligase subunit alpha [Planctomycetota bacterium]|nr:MAG: glycine--tRNA ligase subunit alpha [Planctomycetota bacterium]
MNFQQIILKLTEYWADYGCVITQPTDIEVGAGTFAPATILRALGPEPWKAAYVAPSRRPTDGRYGDNPNRMQFYYQYQVVVKPAPEDSQDIYLKSLEAIGIDLKAHDVRFVEDDWESPTLGASGLGWEVWLDGTEVSQYTYFQQCGSIALDPITLELTYGLERLATFVQGVDSVFDLEWAPGFSYGEIHKETEFQGSTYNFEVADTEMLFELFKLFNGEFENLFERFKKRDKEATPESEDWRDVKKDNLVYPAYEFVMKCSHVFNILDARGAISVQERAAYIGKIRNMARAAANMYLQHRKDLGFPLLKDN